MKVITFIQIFWAEYNKTISLFKINSKALLEFGWGYDVFELEDWVSFQLFFRKRVITWRGTFGGKKKEVKK